MEKALKAMAAVLVFFCLPVGAASQAGLQSHVPKDKLDAEFQMARVMYPTNRFGGSRYYNQPFWGIDYPLSDEHFLAALGRLTKVSVPEDTWHLEMTDDRIFQHPFLFLQQPGQGGWDPTPLEAGRLREYFQRGGFMLVDDFHGDYEWAVFREAMNRVFPDREIVEIPNSDPLMHVFYDLSDRKQLPGERHLRNIQAMGTPHWRGIYDDRGRLMVAMNFNMDMGDSWEHADDPYYPADMTVQGYQLGINYVLYAMTH